jgi:hypothetical protein
MDAFLAAALIPSLLINLISESMNQALVPTLIRVREREGQERAQELLVEFNAVDVRAAGGSLGWHGFGSARVLSADCFALSSGKAGSFGTDFLCPAAGGAAYRNRHQLHRCSECFRALCVPALAPVTISGIDHSSACCC